MKLPRPHFLIVVAASLVGAFFARQLITGEPGCDAEFLNDRELSLTFGGIEAVGIPPNREFQFRFAVDGHLSGIFPGGVQSLKTARWGIDTVAEPGRWAVSNMRLCLMWDRINPGASDCYRVRLCDDYFQAVNDTGRELFFRLI